MSNITAYPLQDWFETTLAQSWNGAIGTVYLNTAPSFTFPSGVKTYIVVNPWKTNMQVGEIDSLHVWNKTVNVSSISVGSWAGTTYTQESHSVWSTVIISDNYQFWKNIVDAVNSKMDLSGGTFTGDVSFSWTGTEFRLPNLTTAERLALTPWNGTIVYDSTLWENYQYIAWAWNAFAAWSTQPNASETVAGKVEEATQTQLNNGDATGETGARLFTNPSKLPTAVASYVTNNAGVNAAVKAEALEVIDDEWVESIVDRDTYLLWEPAAAGDSLFVEDMVTFASATSVQNIWDVTANTRVSIPVIWSGVASTTLKLSLKKFVSPWVDLWVRIETDNSGEPSGTLADANATATVLTSWLTTSLVDTTVTLAWSITLTEWTKYHIVLFAGTYGSETVNGTNYFGIGYRNITTSTRPVNVFDGSNRWLSFWATWVSDTSNITYNATNTETTPYWYRIEAKQALRLTEVTKSATSTATRLVLMTDWGVTINTYSFVWNVATISDMPTFSAWEYFRLEADNSWASYTVHFRNPATFPQNRTNVNYITWSALWGNAPSIWANIDSIETEFYLWVNWVFPYTTSDLFNSKLLSLTDATYSYKLPTDVPRIATESKGTGENVIATTLWFNDNFSGLTPLAKYYISNTPWVISSTVWTNVYPIWQAIDSTTLNVVRKYGVGTISTLNTTVAAANTTVTSTSYLATFDAEFGFIFDLNVSWASSATTGTIQYSLDNSNWFTMQTESIWAGASRSYRVIPVIAGRYYRTSVNQNLNRTGGTTTITLDMARPL